MGCFKYWVVCSRCTKSYKSIINTMCYIICVLMARYWYVGVEHEYSAVYIDRPVEWFFNPQSSDSLTLSVHARESYSSHPVCLSVCRALIWRLLTINCWFRYELTQEEDLGPFIVLLFFNFGLYWYLTKIAYRLLVILEGDYNR